MAALRRGTLSVTLRYRIIFFGTPRFAVPALEALVAGPDVVVGVVCQPDRPSGRGQQVHAPPVKEAAQAHDIAVLQPTKLRPPEFLESLRAWEPDLIVVAAYGRILPQTVLDLPRLGCINVHASLLPRYRGAGPIQWAILRGETSTGVTIMQMNARMDEGDILLQRATPIGAGETHGELEARLATFGAETLQEALALLHRGELYPTPQVHADATLAPLIKKEDGRIDWSLPAIEIARRVRAFNPWPSAHTMWDGKMLKIHRARAVGATHASPEAVPSHAGDQAPGTVVAVGDSLDVATGAGILAIDELQLEGRKRMSATLFARGAAPRVGARFS
jgi:methionyl-tRNA formyltransferase